MQTAFGEEASTVAEWRHTFVLVLYDDQGPAIIFAQAFEQPQQALSR